MVVVELWQYTHDRRMSLSISISLKLKTICHCHFQKHKYSTCFVLFLLCVLYRWTHVSLRKYSQVAVMIQGKYQDTGYTCTYVIYYHECWPIGSRVLLSVVPHLYSIVGSYI